MNPLTWTTLEFEKKDKKPDWFWTVGLVGLLGAVVSFFYKNIFFGIFILIASTVLILYARKHPKQITITITEKGISLNESLIEFKDIKTFWLDETGKEDKLLLLTKTSFIPLLVFRLEGVKADDVRTAIGKNIEEKELRESRSVALFERLGF